MTSGEEVPATDAPDAEEAPDTAEDAPAPRATAADDPPEADEDAVSDQSASDDEGPGQNERDGDDTRPPVADDDAVPDEAAATIEAPPANGDDAGAAAGVGTTGTRDTDDDTDATAGAHEPPAATAGDAPTASESTHSVESPATDGSVGSNGSAAREDVPVADAHTAAPAAADERPAHRRREVRRDRARVGTDLRSLLVRLPFLALAAGVIAAAVATDDGDASATAVPASAQRPALVAAPAAGGQGGASWFCAAGTAQAGGMADHTVVILNLTARPRAVGVTAYPGALVGPAAPEAPAPSPTTVPAAPSDPVTRQVPVPAHGRTEVRLRDLVDAQLAAALVEADGGGLAVEHRLRGEHGGATAPCTTFTADSWHFAWGSTARDAREVLVVFNPFPSAAIVDTTFTTPDGRREPVRLQGLPVPAGSVIGVDVGQEVTRSDQVSATVRVRSGRVVVERLQQYDGTLGIRGLSVSAGAPAPAPAWVFATGEATATAPTTPDPEDTGSTTEDDRDEDERDEDENEGGNQEEDAPAVTSERIVVYNPGRERADVEVTTVPTTDEPAPPVQPFELSIPAGGYEVVDYGLHERIAPDLRHATVVRALGDQPVVAERAIVDVSASGRRSAIAGMPGARLAAPRWLFPTIDGLHGDGPVSFAVVNPLPDRPVDAVVTSLATPGGAAAESERVTVPPGGRTEIVLDADTAGATLAAMVEAEGPVVVERVQYSSDGLRLELGPGIPVALDAIVVQPDPGGGLAGTTYPS